MVCLSPHEKELHQLHDLRAVARRLCCSVKTIRRAVAQRRIEIVMIGSRQRVRETEIRRLVMTGLPEE